MVVRSENIDWRKENDAVNDADDWRKKNAFFCCVFLLHAYEVQVFGSLSCFSKVVGM